MTSTITSVPRFEAQLEAGDVAEKLGSVLDGEHFHLVVGDAVDDSVVLHEDLPDVVELMLGDNAPSVREDSQIVRRLKDLVAESDGLAWSAASYVPADLHQEIDGRLGPGYAGH